MEEEVKDPSWEESSVERGEGIGKELEDSNDDDKAEDVQQEDGDDLVLSDPEGNITGHLMLNWKISCHYLLHITGSPPCLLENLDSHQSPSSLSSAIACLNPFYSSHSG